MTIQNLQYGESQAQAAAPCVPHVPPCAADASTPIPLMGAGSQHAPEGFTAPFG